jgi:cell division protein FtsB
MRTERRFWSVSVLFVACVLLANAIIGEKGLMDSARARRASEQAAQDLARLKRENAALREQVRRLRSDPATIEGVARGLGLVRPGETLVTIRTVK